MEYRTTPEMRRKAIEIFHCDKDPLDYLIKSSGDVVAVEPKESLVKTLFKSKNIPEN